MSVTVVGLDIIQADVLATAAFVMGREGIEYISNKRGFDALAVDKHGKLLMTPDMSEYLLQTQL
jgi:thiamine biosynthesis lipoprotein